MLKQLASVVNGLVKDRTAFSKGFTKKGLGEYIDALEAQHNSLIKTIGPTLEAQGVRIAEVISADSRSFPEYVGFTKQLSNQADALEKSFLGSLIQANKAYVSILQGVRKDLDELFQNEKISLINMKMSHIVVAGVLHQSASLSKYTKYMFGEISGKITGTSDSPKFRINYLAQQADFVADIVNSVVAKSGAIDYKAIVGQIRSEGTDFNLIGPNAKGQVETAGANLRLGRTTSSVVEAGVLGLPGFRSLGEAINILRKELHNFLVKEENWMRGHVSLLARKLDGMDENDEEYVRLVKIIESYEDKIKVLERAREMVW